MRTITKFASIVVLLLLASPVLLLPGCGSDVAEKQGCPPDSYMLNSLDRILTPSDAKVTIGSPFLGGTVTYAPVALTVVDIGQIPRNNICLIVYTDGFWYSDASYSTVITGTGPMNARAVVTNDTGVVNLYWSTEILPPSNPVVGTTAGLDQTGQSWVQAYSGSQSADFLVDWTVKGDAP